MVPALLLLVRAALAASAAPAAARRLPSEKELRAKASAWVEALCAEQKAKCADARGALAGYESRLPQTARCEAGPCPDEKIRSYESALSKFNETAARLPAPRGQASNALLRLGALAGVRLAAAAARIGDDFAAVDYGQDYQTGAALAAEQVCLESPGQNCERARRMIEGAKKDSAEVAACVKTPCPFARLDDLALQTNDHVEKTLVSMPGVKTSLMPIFMAANEPLHGAVRLMSAFVDASTARLRKGGDAYEKRVAAAERDSSADARALPGEAQALMASYQEASYAADRLEQFLAYDKAAGAKRDAVNTQARRLGALRARAFAAVTARGFGDLPYVKALAAMGVVVPTGPAKLKPGVVLTTAKPTLLDRRALPAPPGAGPPPPPIKGTDPGFFASVLNLTSKDSLVRADAERRLHLSRTVGSPGAYAPYAYSQAASDTCAVAAQVEALRAMGLLPRNVSPASQEKEAVQELTRRAYFKGGTMPEYEGELLISKGVLVQKHVKADWPQLEKAIRSGALIQAAIDARGIWGLEKFPKAMPHSILVTGGEVDRRTGKLLGVYINDTGSLIPEGGRFITTENLKKVWLQTFVEVVQ